ncbi:23S rRNA pseudouridine(955/2504/2580) synthase RluC [Microbulbifer thermotolerans]|uniref:Pseudouridine synthase n=1 Tax=Microbulbifer thermotolerans TaxID=252514 RepID=A0AB35HT88_MICTH|nr:23S rRNA pseudouridine(955/2504/2580) synthase RluC [Microbulbifer thermotolerans]MCX2779342.1 23S rRNA pseudouridine(955/2504/2580) synthase RluC [Microbulbifer thermotolerans]MCX2795039.1 23S rRNA pseudouridine(955/2504/2580) synthase RluC [Microbulbifer thermotolerans]MCX2800607.1 23S rRNA pseudouridine(955/2504/2580) synthase RluC [Microbulbifer thermotolerans]MCX2805756.1 23S rRNA pseudouridine(955/2504/2580) synthase RluC [Microbulbifer thermotolerans]MCX2833711.1 23S rRNA pseudouridi
MMRPMRSNPPIERPSEAPPTDTWNPSGGVQFLTVPGELAGQRIDNFLLARMKGVPRARIYRILRKGEVRVNKGRVKAEYRLAAGDVVRVPPVRAGEQGEVPVAGDQLRRLLEASVLYDAHGLLVIDKPAGLAVHGGSGVRLGLIEALRQMYPQSPFIELVHRLDRDTSGAIMVARKRSVLQHVQAELRSGRVGKSYLALAAGKWPRGRRVVEAPLRKNTLKSGERMVSVDPEGKPSETQFRVLERFAGATLLSAEPVTGRTHQIRVHAQFAGCPLAGDAKYTADGTNRVFRELGLKRLFLHSASVRCSLPSGEKVEVSAPLPAELQSVLAALRCRN